MRTVSRRQAGEPASADERPVTYSNVAFVRTRRPFNSWVSWNYKPPRRPKLSVRAGSFEVSASQGMLLEPRYFVIQASGATMWRDRVGWAGTPVNRKDCIRVAAHDKRGRRIEFALTPQDGLENAWQALVDSGVTARVGGTADPAEQRPATN